MRKRTLVVLIGSAVVAAAAVMATLGTAGTTKTHYKIFLLPKATGIPVFTQNGNGAKKAGKELGDLVTYNGPTTVSGSAQVPFINNAVRQGYNAIVISTPDANAVAPALKRAAARGVKIISYDGDTARDARTIFVAPSTNSLIGQYEVQWMGAQIKYKGQIAILSANATSANQNTWITFMKQELR
jgi:rhamnose transport system substrate-binding protein